MVFLWFWVAHRQGMCQSSSSTLLQLWASSVVRIRISLWRRWDDELRGFCSRGNPGCHEFSMWDFGDGCELFMVILDRLRGLSRFYQWFWTDLCHHELEIAVETRIFSTKHPMPPIQHSFGTSPFKHQWSIKLTTPATAGVGVHQVAEEQNRHPKKPESLFSGGSGGSKNLVDWCWLVDV